METKSRRASVWSGIVVLPIDPVSRALRSMRQFVSAVAWVMAVFPIPVNTFAHVLAEIHTAPLFHMEIDLAMPIGRSGLAGNTE